MTKPRGIRLNNPGNIRHGDNWQGMAQDQPDESFVYFVDPRYGYRAMVKVLQSYARRGVVTVRDIINTWAPPVGRDPNTGETYTQETGAYVAHVARRLGVTPDARVDLDNKHQVVELLDAITRHENANETFDRSTIERGYELA
ncbi:MAG: structural protein [Marinobacter sp.]|nr:structural protein [Marinobacter sp.]